MEIAPPVKERLLFSLSAPPALSFEQTRMLRALHFSDDIEVIQIARRNLEHQLLNNTIAAVDLGPNHTILIFTKLNHNGSICGRIISDSLRPESSDLGSATFQLKEADFSGEIHLGTVTYLIKPIGDNLHVICKQR